MVRDLDQFPSSPKYSFHARGDREWVHLGGAWPAMSDPTNALYGQLEDANERAKEFRAESRDLATQLETILRRLKNVYDDGEHMRDVVLEVKAILEEHGEI